MDVGVYFFVCLINALVGFMLGTYQEWILHRDRCNCRRCVKWRLRHKL